MGPAPKGSWTEVVYFGSTAPWAFELGKFNPLENPGKMGNLESKNGVENFRTGEMLQVVEGVTV